MLRHLIVALALSISAPILIISAGGLVSGVWPSLVTFGARELATDGTCCVESLWHFLARTTVPLFLLIFFGSLFVRYLIAALRARRRPS